MKKIFIILCFTLIQNLVFAQKTVQIKEVNGKITFAGENEYEVTDGDDKMYVYSYESKKLTQMLMFSNLDIDMKDDKIFEIIKENPREFAKSLDVNIIEETPFDYKKTKGMYAKLKDAEGKVSHYITVYLEKYLFQFYVVSPDKSEMDKFFKSFELKTKSR